MKKAFSNTTEATDTNDNRFDIVKLTKELIFQQKQKDIEEKQKELQQQLEKEIEEANKFTGGDHLKRKRREDILAEIDEFDDFTDNLSESSDSTDNSLEDADFDEDIDSLSQELDKSSKHSMNF